MLIAVAGAAAVTAGARARRHDDRLAVRRHSEQPAVAGAARRQLGQGARGAAERRRVRAAWRHRVAAVGRRRRRHDGPPASLELRARRAGCGQCRFGPVRRHLRHGHDRAHGDERARRRARARGRHAALAVLARCSCCSRRRSRASFRLRRSRACSPSSRGTWSSATPSRRCCVRRGGDAAVLARDVPAHDLRGFDRGHRRRLRARLDSVHSPNVADDSDRGALAVRRGGRSRRRPARRAARLTTSRWLPTRTSSSIGSRARSSSAPRRPSAPCSTGSRRAIAR